MTQSARISKKQLKKYSYTNKRNDETRHLLEPIPSSCEIEYEARGAEQVAEDRYCTDDIEKHVSITRVSSRNNIFESEAKINS